ncbi:Dead-Box Protein 8, ATP-dependent helicase involved in rRNA processing [Scheffersomyces stipitis CBS 6054]|uniref:ATP-dependent RNA helicase DBP8 n=1 Tax=Scheffersomyces stipitis (strain ATCC 58785 / CBS 6054 / NBRC 10063 / NRRL Y-11545) TaxID=322104 RepID=DBP8_PICST|nr:Dead-Box Protein 8, ATP-dependent helicase involved in rRNA processing [Scheffersomyces stipitis CBS 6054]A3LP87.2 RecName: Full=ATP-dependent RNA helicase DBP8 [Scheffersomyces stipitis CBS 6054]ABN64453.2 Dead-Box Protein 8, ATP-dependent helicase involved in rRNA processing [Scheffersomyces stipitis CBS 6054]
MSFEDLGVSRWLSEALAAMKIHTPTAIQSGCIPKILSGHDCIGGAKTGSGKTIAFAAPMLTQWSEDPFGIFGLVLTPTRELALQIAEQFAALGASMNIKISVVVGGEDFVKQTLELQKKPHFVIATPGRLADHILNSGEETISGLRRIKYLVLDEADRLLSNSFGGDLERCFSVLPPSEKRQTCLFTATVTDAVRALKEKPPAQGKPPVFLHEVETVDQVAIPSTLSIKYVFVPSYVKEAYLNSILRLPQYEKSTAVIFVNRTTTAEVLRRTLRKLEFRVASLHSEMPQSERTNSVQRFKAGAARILIATDVASRGLDIPSVELVVNFDIPADPDDFIHRVGRTARAGRSGDAVTIIAEKDIDRIASIEERINKKMELLEEVTDDSVITDSLTATSVAKRESLMEMDKENFGEKRKINRKKRGLETEKIRVVKSKKEKSKKSLRQ